jgi:hypothetical protein
MNKTKNNLQKIWEQLDNVSGELYNVIDSLSRMSNLPEGITKKYNRIDVFLIDSLKNDIEELINNKTK